MRPYRQAKLPGRNARCPCGSGKKAKRCCLTNIKLLASLPPEARQQLIVASILGHSVNTAPETIETIEHANP